ncbi:phosphonate ABC transporter, permease protein PhnE [Halomarina rubra]|uniref:Phosphonate ABC transporter, permease protein PhnE n=1 Tax=Halomarina rubra TaxID=2071873 RepID=A0ABD6ATN8_9EURY|nr:phosphonate ABC transporter, permease protein PhnE [Halomarina rubra]
MSSENDSLGYKLRAYFGIGYEGEDAIDQRLTDLKRAKTIGRILSLAAAVGFLYLFSQALGQVGFSIDEIVRYWPAFSEAMGGFFPTTTYLGIPFLDFGAYWSFISNPPGYDHPLWDYAVTTLAMSFAGTALGFPLALLFGILGSERVTPFPFNFIFRGVMSTIRAIPALVWALIFIPLGGLSPFTATLAIGTDTIGNMGRLFTDELEEIEEGPIEGISSTGANRPQTVVFGMLSQVYTSFIAWALYIFEINTRVAVTMGLIGGGGLGAVLSAERRFYNPTNIMATILVVLVLVITVEMISQRIRAYLRGDWEPMSTAELFLGFPRRMTESLWR